MLLRKMGLVMAASLVTDASSQVAAAMLVLVPSLWLQATCRPYSLPKANAVESLSLMALVVTATVSLVYLRAQGGAEAVAQLEAQPQQPWVDVAVTAVLIATNALVLSLAACAVVRSGDETAGAASSSPACVCCGRRLALCNGEEQRMLLKPTTAPTLSARPGSVSFAGPASRPQPREELGSAQALAPGAQRGGRPGRLAGRRGRQAETAREQDSKDRTQFAPQRALLPPDPRHGAAVE